ncbi:MAG TPA: hypothetical protein VFY27_10700, partial [Woeseiaceae bacterium]|nr:hypothetical protein [Woeseiaceae bacterium]
MAAVADFLVLTALLDDFLVPFLLLDLLPAVLFAEGFAAVFLRAAPFPAPADFLLTFFVAFFLTGVLEADFFVDFRADFFVDFFDPAGFFRAADFFFDAFFVEAFFALTLRFLPGAFLLAADFPDAVVFLPPPARFGFLLAAFFAGIFHSCRSEKNAELYIGCPNMEAQFGLFFPGAAGICSRSARLGCLCRSLL